MKNKNHGVTAGIRILASKSDWPLENRRLP